jgi:hypothetical protein
MANGLVGNLGIEKGIRRWGWCLCVCMCVLLLCDGSSCVCSVPTVDKIVVEDCGCC